MKLILHIGMSKAGSSAIQGACIKYWDALLENGILYPEAGRDSSGSHHLLAAEIRKKAPNSLELWKELHQELEKTSAHTALISAEQFWFLKSEKVDVVQELTSKYETSIILYLRNPVGYLNSSYRQGIKTGKRKENWEDWIRRALRRIDYPEIIKRWQKFSLDIRSYDREQRNLVPLFFNRLGLDIVVQNQQKNVTPSDGVLRMMLWVNKAERILGLRGAKAIRRKLNTLQSKKVPLPAFRCDLSGLNKVVQAWDFEYLSQFVDAETLQVLTNGIDTGKRSMDTSVEATINDY